jgi:hypothetical protein
VADGYAILPGLPELGPVARDRRVEVECALLREPERADRGDGLPHREEVDDRVLLPGPRPGGVPVAGPQVDDRFLAHVDGERDAHLAAGIDAVGEGPAQ